MSESFDIFVAAQTGVISQGPGKCKFLCPCHDDSNPSAHASIGDNGKVVAHCFSCNAKFVDMVHASGLTMAKVFPKSERNTPFKKGSFVTPAIAIKFYEKKLGPMTAKWTYQVNGSTVGYVVRFDPPGQKKEFRPIWKDGRDWVVSAPKENRPLYYGDSIKEGSKIYVTEGEKACDAAKSIGLTAVSPMNGAKSPHKTDWSKTKGHDVVILRDNDEAGIEFANKIAQLCLKAGATSAKVLLLPVHNEGDDIVEWIAGKGDACEPQIMREEIDQMVATAQRIKGTEADKKTTFELKPISSREFAIADYRLEYLIKRVWVKDQPCMLGGPHKALKTGTMLEIAISGGTGTPLFGKPEFAVPKPFNVMVLSGESGKATLQETAHRIAFAHKVKLADAQIWWEDTLPKIAKPDHLLALGDAITKVSAKLCLIDPAYLCLLSGDTQGRQASNLFDVGALLTGLADIGRQTGCGIGLAHHMKKNPAEPFAIPKLEDLAYAGFAEFARQWLLINRRSEYRDDGRHELWLSIGGSAGHSSTWAYTVEEGIPDDNFRGRYWDVSIERAAEAIEGKKRDKERQRENDRHAKVTENVERVMEQLRSSKEPQTPRSIREILGISPRDFTPVWDDIMKRKVLTQSTIKGGNGRKYEAYSMATVQRDTAGLLRDFPAIPLQEQSNGTGAL